MRRTADVVIVGAGLHGAGLAMHLAKAGAGSILVLEKRHLAAGPTAKSGAMVRPFFSQAVYIQLVLEATALFEQWDDQIGGDVGFVQRGFFRITDSLKLDRLGGDLTLMRDLGVPYELIAQDDLSRISPICAYHGGETGVLLTKGGYADPIRTTAALAAAARRLGVEFAEDVTVTGIETLGGRVEAVVTDKGRVATHLVVNCAGAWSANVAAMVGVDLPIVIHRVPTALYRRPEAFLVEGPVVSDGVNQVYMRSAGDSHMRAAHFGWSADPVNPDSYDETISRAQHDSLRTLVDRRFPAMRASPSVGGFSAVYDMTPDAHPIVGQVGETEGFWCNCGWSGNGFASGPAVGRHLAARMMGGTSEVDLSTFAWPRAPDATARPDVNWVHR